ncbi:hypothetical protein ACFLQL_00740 [Verrucomicrobiota bacterium]
MNKKDIALLGKAADCIDDCLVMIYPEEFDDWQIIEARKRFALQRGIIARTATMADGLRKLKKKLKENNE